MSTAGGSQSLSLRRRHVYEPEAATARPGEVHAEEEALIADPSHPAMWAISYDQLLEIETIAKEKFGCWSYRWKTMRDINQHIIIPRCREFGGSYSLWLNPTGLRLGAFITHSWDEPFAEFLHSIKAAFLPFPEKPNLWICAFALWQGPRQQIKEQLEGPLDHAPFVRAMREAKWFVVVRNSRTDLYSRIWCVCELMYARRFGFTATQQTLVVGPDKFAKSQISCLHAQAFDQGDKRRILDSLRREHGSVDVIDALVKQYRAHIKGPGKTQQKQAFAFSTILLLMGVGLVILGTFAFTPRYFAPAHLVRSPLTDVTFLPAYSIEAINQDPWSPQARALQWMKDNEDNDAKLGGWNKTEVFGFSVLNYATPQTLALKGNIFWMFGDTLTPRWGRSLPCSGTFDYGYTSMCCSAGNHNMESIDFVHGSGRELLPGTIPPELSLLTCLTTLVLTFKDGTIPTELGLLTKLRRLELISGGFGGSSIKGSIPTEIGMMTALTSISFPQGLNGTLPSEIGRLTGLTALFLNKTDFCYHWEECFQGTIPSEIGLLSGLESLELGNNMLGGLLPSELGLLTSLLSFGHSCQVSCDRHNGTFSGQIPSEMGLMKALTNLQLTAHRFSGTLPTELGNLAALEYMTVGYNGGLTGPLPTELRVIPCIDFTRITFSRWCMKEPRLVSADGYNRELCWGGQSTETPYFCPKGVSNSTL